MEATSSATGDLHPPSIVPFQCRSVRPGRREAMLTWLNRGLRGNRKQRLESEFPTALFSHDLTRDLENHILIHSGNCMASHALVHTITAKVMDRTIEVGLIGMVYTDPVFRRRGAARLGLEHAIAKIQDRGVPLAILWSDLDAFYKRLGFDRAGIENFYLLNSSQCRRASGPHADTVSVRPVHATDWEDLERLYDAKSCRQHRRHGDLARLAAAPDCETLVAVQDGQLTAYASMGRGDDFPGIVHEWAGEATGLIACLERFTRSREEITLLEGPIQETATRPLRKTGTRPHPASLGLMKILDVEKLWSTLSSGCSSLANVELIADASVRDIYVLKTPHHYFRLSHKETLSLLFGPAIPRSLLLTLDSEIHDALQKRFPWPLFLWGFDSI